MRRIFSIIGESGIGKTTLIEKLIKELRKKRFKVCVIKHCHHGFDLDHSGKDSWRFNRAGASSIILTSPERIALMKRIEKRYRLKELDCLIGDDVDIVFIEGFRKERVKKIFIYKKGGEDKIPPQTIAIYGDRYANSKLPYFSKGDIKGLCRYILRMKIL